jgi:tRNA modification GTPase
MSNNDTIAAIATASGVGGVGVIRVSGARVKDIAVQVLGELPPKRRATSKTFLNKSGDIVDSGLAIFFQGPYSYTGEDVLELQGHGGVAVLRMLLRACTDAGARVAQPGEFTQRAYLNNKLDLAQAESVADLIEASSEAAVLSANRSLSGEFSDRVSLIRNELIEIRVFIEAAIDFSDEEIDFIETHQMESRMKRLSEKLVELRGVATQGNLLREGVKVVLAGEPNVGKSTLMNLLAEEDVSIVTEHEGTTRDLIQRRITIKGVPILLTDTAGLRLSSDPVEKIGIQRTISNLKEADIILELRAADSVANRFDDMTDIDENRKIAVVNKIDLSPDLGHSMVSGKNRPVYLSAKTGEGLSELKERLLEKAGVKMGDEAPFMARERHLNALRSAERHVDLALINIESIDLCAEDLRLGQNSLSEVTGEFVADDLLGEIFSSFCVGK